MNSRRGRGEHKDETDVSITATLDRAQALDAEMINKTTSNERRMEILSELRSWTQSDDNSSGSSSSGGSQLLFSGMPSPREQRRPTSSSSAPATPDTARNGHGGGNNGAPSSAGRRTTRQPGQTAGVLVEWPGGKKGTADKNHKEKTKARNARKKQKAAAAAGKIVLFIVVYRCVILVHA